jgi:hypothetical protein
MYTTKTVDSQTTSPWIPLDDNQAAFNVSVAVTVTGTLTYTVQFTLDNIQDPSVTPVAFEVSGLTSKTADASTSLRSSVKAVRLNITSYTSGSATIGVRQGTSWDGVDFATSSGPVVLYQSGIPFWLPPGDGGANGLSFTGTRGVFTLSAEAPLPSSYLALASGGYCYLPAGAGGLVAGGWYWCVMADGTNGEVFANTYPGAGKPDFVSSPAALPNLSAGRISQAVSEIYGPSFTMPGGSMGPNGLASWMLKWIASSSATSKTSRVYVGPTTFFSTAVTTTNLDQLVRATRFNQGVQNRQIGNRRNAFTAAWDGGNGATTWSGDVTTVDTSVDQTVSFALQLGANTDSMILYPLRFEFVYGA